MFSKSETKANVSVTGRSMISVFVKCMSHVRCLGMVPSWPAVSAVQQPPGGCRVVGGQHHKARQLLLEREDLAGGLGELMPLADAGELAALEEFRPVGEVPGQQQRRPGAPADQQ